MNPEKFNVPSTTVSSVAELMLVQARMKSVNKYTEELLLNRDSEVSQLVLLLIKKGFLLQDQKELNAEFYELQDEADELISSVDAQTPVVLQRREEIKQRVNEILDIQEHIEEALVQAEGELLLYKNISSEKQEEADQLVEKILDKTHNAINPPYHLN